MIKSLIQLVVGNGLVQILAFIAAPFITRYYGADVVGAFGLVAAVSAFLVPISTLRLELSLPSEKDDTVAKCIFSTAISLSIFSFFLFFLLYSISSFFVSESIKFNAIIFSPFWVLVLSINQIFSYWFVRNGQFNVIAKSNLIRGLLQNTTIFIPLVFFVSFSAFMWAKIISAIMVCIWLFIQIKGSIDFKDLFKFEFYVITKNKDYTTHGVFQALLNGFGSYLPQFTFAYQYSLATLGQLSMAFFLVQAPTGLLSQGIRQVFHKKFADLLFTSVSKLAKFYKYSVLALFTIYFVIVLLYWLFGRSLIVIYLGEGWIDSFEYSKWLCIWFGMTVINPLPNIVLQIIKKQKILTIYEVIYLATRVICVILFLLFTNAVSIHLVQLLSIIGFLFNCFIITYVYQILRKNTI
ncbi:lipopolysaccharide biosynthesis protein [Aliivibrio fischeri]|uniref:lipopolysaccharide biosynthesis protein n=1 Tax=Aliivibrio fischeri TaxID=668 RepID=UPI00105F4808|nr:oligosaccharide flippase family protein [Aliivibrio fischeri]TDM56048.1 hypothetical protein VFFQA001_01015 [Aliivibrio fischeri]